VSAVYLQQFPSYSNNNWKKSSFLRTPAFIFCLPWGRPCGNHAKRCMNEKTIQCLPNASQQVLIYLEQFPSYSNRKCKKSSFSRTAAHIFVSPGDAPAIITQYVACIERQFNACQTPRSMYLSIFNSFRVIRCLSQCVSPKIAIFYKIFVSPGDAPGAITLNVIWMEREFDAYKLSRCMCPCNYNRFWDRARYLWKNRHFIIPLAFDAPVRVVPVGISAPPLVRKN